MPRSMLLVQRRLRTRSPLASFHSARSPFSMSRAWARARGMVTVNWPWGSFWMRTVLDKHIRYNIDSNIYVAVSGVGERCAMVVTDVGGCESRPSRSLLAR